MKILKDLFSNLSKNKKLPVAIQNIAEKIEKSLTQLEWKKKFSEDETQPEISSEPTPAVEENLPKKEEEVTQSQQIEPEADSNTPKSPSDKINNYINELRENPKRLVLVLAAVGGGLFVLFGDTPTEAPPNKMTKSSSQQQTSQKPKKPTRIEEQKSKLEKAAKPKDPLLINEVQESALKKVEEPKPVVQEKTVETPTSPPVAEKPKEIPEEIVDEQIKRSDLDLKEMTQNAPSQSTESQVNIKNIPKVQEQVLGEEKVQSNLEKANLKIKESTSPIAQQIEGLKSINKITQRQIEQEYSEPPTYDRLGKGLVYNCKDKHWACIDKANFFICRNHQLWAKNNNSNPSCVIDNVYISLQDCMKMQRYNIHNLASQNQDCGTK